MSQAEQLSDETSGISDFHWQFIAESIPHLFWMASSDGWVEYINQLGIDYTGWSPGATYDTAGYRLRRTDGEYRWHVSRGLPLRDAGGEIVKWIGTATHSHDQRTSESRLREGHRTTEEALALLATLQAEAPVGFGFVDRDLCLARLN